MTKNRIPTDSRASTVSDSTCHGCTELMELDKALECISELEAKLADLEHGHEKLLEKMSDKIVYVHDLIAERDRYRRMYEERHSAGVENRRKVRLLEAEVKTLRNQIITDNQPVCDHCGQKHFAGEGSSRWCR